MRYFKLKSVMFTLLTACLFPVTAYAVVDGGSYITTTNNDVNTQSLHTDVSYNADGSPNFDSMYMTTESTGDHKWTSGAMMHSNSITLTVKNGGQAQTVTLFLEQSSEDLGNGYVKTTYNVVSPVKGQSVNDYLHSQLTPDNYAGLAASITGNGYKQTGDYRANTNTYVECNNQLAVTPDGATQQYWSSYQHVTNDGSVKNISAWSVLYNTKVTTEYNGRMNLASAIDMQNSLMSQIKTLRANGATDTEIEKLETQLDKYDSVIENIKAATGLKTEDINNLVAGYRKQDDSLMDMLSAMEKAARQAGISVDELDGLLTDSGLDWGTKFLENMHFYDPTTLSEHINWEIEKMKAQERNEKTVWHQGIGEPYTPPYKEEQSTWRDGTPYEPPYKTEEEEGGGGEKPDFRHEPYEPWGEITKSPQDAEYHRVGADGNIFNLGEPIAYTYNDSVEYDDYAGHHAGFADERYPGIMDTDSNGYGIVIPSSERYLNGITVNTTNGKASLGLGSQECKYTGKYSYQIQQIINAWELVDVFKVDGEEVSEGTYENCQEIAELGFEQFEFDHYKKVEPATIEGCLWSCDFSTRPGVTVSTIRYGYYLYLEDLDVKDFTTMTTYNDTFTNDTQDYNSTDLHVYRDIPPGETRVNAISGSVQGRPTTYHVEEGYKDGAVNITSTATDAGAGRKTSSFIPDGAWHLDWNVEPTDWGYGNYQLGTFTVGQTAENPGVDGEFEGVPTAGGLYHYWGGNVTNNPTGTPGGVVSCAQNQLEYDVGDMKNVSTKTAGGEVWNLAEYKSGKLTLPGQGGAAQTIMAGQTGLVTHKGADDTWDSSFQGTTVPSYLRPVMSAILGAGSAYQSAKESMIESYESTPALGKEQQHIPDEQANGEYPTSIQNVFYKQVLVAKAMAGKTTSGMGIKPAYGPNEPIIIQTPVVSPVSVWLDNGAETGSSPLREYTPGEGENQLVHEDDSVRQFRLDESYWFKFDPLQHLITQGYADINGIPFDNTWRDDNIKFDKYTEAKYVHFPFDVCIYEGGTNGDLDHPVITDETPTYHPHVTDESDPNYWIKIYDRNDSGTMDNIEWNKFYIPSWAHEDAYTSGDVIKYKVEAINVSNAGTDAEEEEKNEYGDPKRPNKEKYIATYTIKCQVSGWLYNFQVVGSNLRDMYDKELSTEDETKWHDLYYAYCFDREEKKAGIWNRLANDFEDRYGWVSNYLRYTVDGTATNSWDPKDTIVIAAHNSHRLNNPGVAPAGTQFAYSFQSMANLWNRND